MPPTRGGRGADTSDEQSTKPRRTLKKQINPLPKGAACIPCATRRVRCSGERPACAACVRHAHWNGKDSDPETNHGCSYKRSVEEEELKEVEEETELQSAKNKIKELVLRIAELEGGAQQEARSATVVAAGSESALFGAESPPTSAPFPLELNITQDSTLASPNVPTAAPHNALNLDLVYPNFASGSVGSSCTCHHGVAVPAFSQVSANYSTPYIGALPSPPLSLAATPSPTIAPRSLDLVFPSFKPSPLLPLFNNTSSSLSYPPFNTSTYNPLVSNPYFALTPPPSTVVSPSPSYFNMPVTLTDIFTIPSVFGLDQIDLTTINTFAVASTSTEQGSVGEEGGGVDEGSQVSTGSSFSFQW